MLPSHTDTVTVRWTGARDKETEARDGEGAGLRVPDAEGGHAAGRSRQEVPAKAAQSAAAAQSRSGPMLPSVIVGVPRVNV